MDRSDVVKAWECCIDSDDPCAEDCPMKDAKWKKKGLAACRAFADGHVEVPLALIQRTVELLKAQKPRVMTLEEYKASAEKPKEERDPVWEEWPELKCAWAMPNQAYGGYGTSWRCWTSRPTDEQREAEPWE